MDIHKLIADAIEEELALGGDPKSCASATLGALTDEGYEVRLSPRGLI